MLGLLLVISLAIGVAAKNNKNVLLIISDDMRPDIGVFSGDYAPTPVYPTMYTPNLDALAADSLLLTHAYVQYPLCTPSRASMLTGRRPDTIHVYQTKDEFREAGNFTTLPQLFKENGYFTTGMGKVFHQEDEPLSWSDDFFKPKDHYNHIEDSWAAIPLEESSELPLVDQITADQALLRMRELAPAALSGEQPFFIAAGFKKPHLSFIFPEEYMELYPEEEVELAQTQSVPVDFPPVAWNRCGGLCDKIDINETCEYNETIPDYKALELRRAYYSCISYVDGLVGLLLQELDELGLRDDTIVVFVGDHGWQLGEHNEWCKTTNFEESLHAPVMIRIPGMTDGGIVTNKLTEFVDIYPTVIDAAGFDPIELCPEESADVPVCREGTSLMALVEDPKRDDWKQRVFSQVDRNGKNSNATWNNIMGYSVRNSNFRYTEWVKFRSNHYEPDWDSLEAAELYELNLDPEETMNLVHNPDYADNVKTMSKHLQNGWRDDGIKQPE